MTTETVLTSDERDKFVGDLIDYGTDFVAPLYEVVESIEQAVLQSPEVVALLRDAERYRVLRDEEYQMLEDDPCVTDDSFNTFFGEDLDEAVDALTFRRDAAMKERP